MVKKVKYTYKGMNQDVARSKHPFQFYYEANNIRIIATDSQTTGSVQNEKGNEHILSLPSPCIDVDAKVITYNDKSLPFDNSELEAQINDIPAGECDDANTLPQCSGEQVILGYGLSRDGIILFSTDKNGFDCIWEVKEIFDDNYDLELLYCRNLDFSIDNPIQSIFNFENEKIQKVYWVDGLNQLRFLNIKHSIENGDLEELIDISASNLNIVGDYDLSQPIIASINQGGTHTAGMIQYAYNLYRLNGAQTVISPLSELIPLDFGGGAGGGTINETVSSTPVIQINDLDTKYTNIKIYAIKYTSYNEEPSVGLIYDELIDNYETLTYFDSGSVINTLSLSEFLFLGSNVVSPKHIESKDNRLFAANIEDRAYDLEIDTRAYSFNGSQECKLWDTSGTLNPNNFPAGPFLPVDNTTFLVPETHDAINPDYSEYNKNLAGDLGGEGKYIKYELLQKTEDQLDNIGFKRLKFFKDNEYYRLGIKFYNKLGQSTPAKWVADIKAPQGNLEGNYNTLKVELKPEFNDYIDSLCLDDNEKPTGFRILRMDRTVNDKTIICQGSFNPTLCQTTRLLSGANVEIPGITTGHYWLDEAHRREETERLVKIPLPWTKNFISKEGGVNPIGNFELMSGRADGGNDDQEIHSEGKSSFQRQKSWQSTQLLNFYSPEILFNIENNFIGNLNVIPRGLAARTSLNRYHIGYDIRSGNIYTEEAVEDITYEGRGGNLRQYGFVGPGRDEEDFRSIYFNTKRHHHALTDFHPAINNTSYKIYGIPEVADRGQGISTYNGDQRFKYSNTLQSFLTDRKDWATRRDKDEDAITSMNSFGARCAMIVLGDKDTDVNSRPTLESMANGTGSIQDKSVLIADIAFGDDYFYTSNIYGGKSYESKSRGSYVEIGNYNDITDTTVIIDSPGDTYVQIFNFARIGKSDTDVLKATVYQMTETMEYKVETSVNLLNRSDLSLQNWDSKSQPKDDEYHEYNRVYSQQPNLLQDQAVGFKFKRVNSFDTRIQSSKLKVPGETIDNWTDFLENEIIDLDGKYGAINSLVNFNDNIFSLQDQGVARISINPRVQVQADDGLSLELGKGNILYDYDYASTKSGTINKWSVFSSPTGFYYLDAINKSWNKFTGGVGGLSTTKGLHSFFEKELDYSTLKVDNPLIKQGVTGGFDFINGNAYVTLHQGDGKGYTLNYNELTDSFESFHDYIPSIYINRGNKMYTTEPNLNELWEHDKGEYNSFYGVKYPSTITLMVNPEADLDCVFNNIEFKSEIYLNDIDQPEKTLTHLSAWNEYQTTNRIPLVLGRNKNLRRKFRNWQAQIPRQAGSRDRIRNPWIFLKLELDHEDNLKMVLHDMIIHYTV